MRKPLKAIPRGILWLLVVLLAPVAAHGTDTTYRDITVEWECGLSDLTFTEQWEYDFYYESAQLSPFGEVMSFRIVLPSQYAQHEFSTLTLWSTMGGISPSGFVKQARQKRNEDGTFSDLVLEAIAFVSVANPAYEGFFFLVEGFTSDSIESATSFFVIVSLAQSARNYIGNNPDLKGGCADNPNSACDEV